MKIRENLAIEEVSNKTPVSINKELVFTVKLGYVNVTDTLPAKKYKIITIIECDNLVTNDSARLMTQIYGDVSGWGSGLGLYPQSSPSVEAVNGQIRITHDITTVISNTENTIFHILCRIDGVRSGTAEFISCKFEEGETSTLYIPHRSLLTSEQSVITPEHLFSGGGIEWEEHRPF